MIIVNKRKLILPVALAFGVIMLFMLLGGTVAYLTDTEKGVNVITIGKVGLALTEPQYDLNSNNSSVLAAGDSLEKDPKLTNTGTKDEFVFIEVAVPKRNVTLLYEEETTIVEGNDAKIYKEGTPTVNNYNDESSIIKKSDEIYKIIADGRTDGAEAVNLTANGELGTDADNPNTKPQLDFSYNKGSNSSNAEKEGWIYLSREVDKTVGTDDNELTYDYYYFGYNKKLSSDHSTIPLFDRIQLKSFIDEEIKRSKANEETKILITGYGIQADSLGISDLNTEAFQDKEMLNKIFNIVKQKKG